MYIADKNFKPQLKIPANGDKYYKATKIFRYTYEFYSKK